MKNQRIQQIVTRVRGTFDGFTRGQRAITVIAIVVAIVGGVVFYRWVSQPVMTALYPNALTQQDAASVTTALDGMGVRYTLDGTTVSVPRDHVDKARIDLAAQNLPAQTNQQDGYALVENAPMTTSDAQQRVLIKRATEGELKKAIEKIDTVQSATVQLALPEPDVFTRDQAPTTASVLVAPKPNQSITGGQVEAITHLVASAVPKLDPDKVTITDSNGALLSASGPGGGAGTSEQRLTQQASFQSGVSQQLQALLDKTVGPGNSTVAVRADLDFSNTREWTNEYIQPQAGAPPLQTDTTRELYTGAGQTPVGGVLGPDNIPVPNANSGAGGDSRYQKDGEKSINPYGTRQTYRDGTAGQVGRLNVSVLLDSRTTGAMPLGPIQTAVCAAAGIDPARQDTCTVAKVPFDTAAAQAAAAAAAAADEQARSDQLIQLAKNVGLGLLLLLALLIGFRQNRKRARTIDIGQLESVEGPMVPGLPGAPAAIEAGPAEFELDSDEALRVLQATPIDPQSQARMEAREEISTLAQENPDEVARLLRGWISERS